MQVQRVLKMQQLRGICLCQTHTKAQDAAKALPASELQYKEKTGNSVNSKETFCDHQLQQFLSLVTDPAFAAATESLGQVGQTITQLSHIFSNNLEYIQKNIQKQT